ncbi:hypothetical protein HK096_010423, partial [Nowakowskiella sp. JEL0078]
MSLCRRLSFLFALLFLVNAEDPSVHPTKSPFPYPSGYPYPSGPYPSENSYPSGLPYPLYNESNLGSSLSKNIIFKTKNQWTTMFRRTCNGTYEFIPNVPVGFSISFQVLEDIIDKIGDLLWERASCQCPTLTQRDFLLHFDPIAALLNALENKEHTLTPETKCKFPISLTQFSGIINLKETALSIPSLLETCNIETWLNSGVCALKVEFVPVSVNLTVNLVRCPNCKWGLPEIEVQCSGPGCQTLSLPCSSDTQCNTKKTKQTCFKVYSDKNAQRQGLIGFMTLLFGPNGARCYTIPGSDLITGFFTLVRNFFDDQVVSDIGFCGISEIEIAAGTLMQTSTIQPNYSAPADVCLLPPTSPGYDVEFGFLHSSAAKVGILNNYLNHKVENRKPNTLLEFTCKGQFGIYDDAFNVAMGTSFMDLISGAENIIYNIANCILQSKLTQEQFLIRYGLWSPSYWLYKFDAGLPSNTVNLGAPGYDWTSLIPSYFKVAFPASCTYETWAKTGVCFLQWTGLGDLFNIDATLALTINRCPVNNNPRFRSANSEASLKCVGKDCNLIIGTRKPCQTNNDCGKGVCFDFDSILNMIIGSLGGSEIGELQDPLGRFIFPINVTSNDACDIFNGKGVLNPKCSGAQ